MNEEVKHLVKLVAFPTEVGAAAVVAALNDAGIKAVATGDITAGFRAEAPGDVQVMVAKRDLDEARRVLETVHKEMQDVDWSQVDVGEPEDQM